MEVLKHMSRPIKVTAKEAKSIAKDIEQMILAEQIKFWFNFAFKLAIFAACVKYVWGWNGC